MKKNESIGSTHSSDGAVDLKLTPKFGLRSIVILCKKKIILNTQKNK